VVTVEGDIRHSILAGAVHSQEQLDGVILHGEWQG
jgi:hypothetical protein